MTKLTPRPYQQKTHNELFGLIDSGYQRICVSAPTGAGKALTLTMAIEEAVQRGWRVSLYTHRSVLIPQLSGVLSGQGIAHGIRASGFEPDLNQQVQISMFQTEAARCFGKRKTWNPHGAKLVLIDEAHGYTASITEKIVNHHIENGAAVAGFTATPVDLWHMYDKLIVMTKNSDLRACGAHLPCLEYAPDEPDIQGMRKTAVGEFVESDVVKKMMVPTIYGRVREHYNRLNPFRMPTILFGPSVEGSKFFCDDLNGHGIVSAHIDAKHIYYGCDQKSGAPIVEASNQRNRQNLFDRVRSGEIKVLCNRFVLTEGLDLPELHVAILATMFGSVKMYLQAAGRLLRAHPSMTETILQDHGGNRWRHGSINEDRVWEVGDTSKKHYDERVARMEQGEEELCGITCPKCGYVRLSGPKCHQCGHSHVRSGRMVVQTDGTLKRQYGPQIKKKRQQPQSLKDWQKLYWRSRNSKSPQSMNWNQLWGQFKHKNPNLMPHINTDKHGRERLAIVDPQTHTITPLPFHPPLNDTYLWSLKVKDVPVNQLLK